MSYIYKLIDKKSKTPFYVGKSNDPQRRFGEHIRESRRQDGRNPKKEAKIRELGYKNGVEIVVIEYTENWQEREMFWIKYYLNQFELTNLDIPTIH